MCAFRALHSKHMEVIQMKLFSKFDIYYCTFVLPNADALQLTTPSVTVGLNSTYTALRASERVTVCEYCWCRKRYGLAEFLPRSLLSSAESFRLLTSDANSVDRSLRRRLSRLIDETRRARNKAGKPLGSLQIKLQYLRVISQLPSYGIRCFLVRKLKPRLHMK